jgi:hypothetical protein
MKAEIDPDEWTAKRRRLRAAIDALAPYSRPPKAAGSLSKKQSSSKPVGRPQNDEELARDLLDGWRAYKPENGRPRKEDYLAQRPDVRVLKTEQARQSKIAALRTALDSALALRRSKTRQKRKARG